MKSSEAMISHPHGVRSCFDPWLFFTHYRHLTFSKLMTPTSLKNGASGRRCGSITASLQKLTKKETFKTWNLSTAERKDIKGVVERFDNYCYPRKNIPSSAIFSIYNSKGLASRLIAM